MIKQNEIKKCVKQFLMAIGADVEGEGLKDTPDRVARMCGEIFAGMELTNDQIVEMCDKTFPNEDIDVHNRRVVKVGDIDAFSFCEHHLALMYDMKINVSYIPSDCVIGLSKIVRAVNLVTKRLQLQERITTDIAYVISKLTHSQNIAVVVTAKHSCVSMRGVKNIGSKTTTHYFGGEFEQDEKLQALAVERGNINDCK